MNDTVEALQSQKKSWTHSENGLLRRRNSVCQSPQAGMRETLSRDEGVLRQGCRTSEAGMRETEGRDAGPLRQA